MDTALWLCGQRDEGRVLQATEGHRRPLQPQAQRHCPALCSGSWLWAGMLVGSLLTPGTGSCRATVVVVLAPECLVNMYLPWAGLLGTSSCLHFHVCQHGCSKEATVTCWPPLNSWLEWSLQRHPSVASCAPGPLWGWCGCHR